MLPPEEYLIVHKTICNNMNNFKTLEEFMKEFPNIVGQMYYDIYKSDLDELIAKIWNEK